MPRPTNGVDEHCHSNSKKTLAILLFGGAQSQDRLLKCWWSRVTWTSALFLILLPRWHPKGLPCNATNAWRICRKRKAEWGHGSTILASISVAEIIALGRSRWSQAAKMHLVAPQEQQERRHGHIKNDADHEHWFNMRLVVSARSCTYVLCPLVCVFSCWHWILLQRLGLRRWLWRHEFLSGGHLGCRVSLLLRWVVWAQRSCSVCDLRVQA